MNAIQGDAGKVVEAINDFTSATFLTRGGRLGSGMGGLLEALWIYYMNRTLRESDGDTSVCELAWLEDHQPADYACINKNAIWEPEAGTGQFFQIEAKSMNLDVDEAKGHFTNLARETSDHDQLLVIVWSWEAEGQYYRWPKITDYFIGHSSPIIEMRDALHVLRGGTFVGKGACPDGCELDVCAHTGEPLNKSGVRERRTGPISAKGARVDYAANFGGLLRMIKTSSTDATEVFRDFRRSCDVCHRFISFIHKHYPNEEMGQYRLPDWRQLGSKFEVDTKGLSAQNIRSAISQQFPTYRDSLREL